MGLTCEEDYLKFSCDVDVDSYDYFLDLETFCDFRAQSLSFLVCHGILVLTR